MKTIKDIKRSDINRLFASHIFYRGEDYFEDGLVEEIDPIDSKTIVGTVNGNRSYNVTINIDSEGDLIVDCSCPCDFNCKHAAALLLKWLDIKKDFTKIKSSSKPSIDKILKTKKKEDLILLVKEMMNRKPELQSLIVIEKGKTLREIKKLFSDYWDYTNVHKLIKSLKLILDGINQNKSSWNSEILIEMKKCLIFMLNESEEIRDDGEVSIFCEEWLKMMIDVFLSQEPSTSEKKDMIKWTVELEEKYEYPVEIVDDALVNFCRDEKDIKIVKKILESRFESDQYEDNSYIDSEYYNDLYGRMYDKIGMTDMYFKICKETRNFEGIIDKLISLNKLKEALKVCEENKKELISHDYIRIEILKKMGDKGEYKKALFNIIKKNGNFSDFTTLKKASTKNEWNKYLKRIIEDAKSKNKRIFLQKIYFDLEDYKTCYKYLDERQNNVDFLEHLARKLSKDYPKYACKIYSKLIIYFISCGSGWPYKKAGLMLKAIKKIDSNRSYFDVIKQQIIDQHKKKYSLIKIIEKV